MWAFLTEVTMLKTKFKHLIKFKTYKKNLKF